MALLTGTSFHISKFLRQRITVAFLLRRLPFTRASAALTFISFASKKVKKIFYETLPLLNRVTRILTFPRVAV